MRSNRTIFSTFPTFVRPKSICGIGKYRKSSQLREVGATTKIQIPRKVSKKILLTPKMYPYLSTVRTTPPNLRKFPKRTDFTIENFRNTQTLTQLLCNKFEFVIVTITNLFAWRFFLVNASETHKKLNNYRASSTDLASNYRQKYILNF